jgi:hypothetical protein
MVDSYVVLGRVDDAVRLISDVTRREYSDSAEIVCEQAEKLMRSGHEPQARTAPDDLQKRGDRLNA